MENPLSKGVELEVSPGMMEDYNHMDVTRLRERIKELEVKNKGLQDTNKRLQERPLLINYSSFTIILLLTRMRNCNLTNECTAVRKIPHKKFLVEGIIKYFGDDQSMMMMSGRRRRLLNLLIINK